MNMLSRKLASVGLAVALAIGFGLGAAAPANASVHHYKFESTTYFVTNTPGSSGVLVLWTTRGFRHGVAHERANGTWAVSRGGSANPTRWLGSAATLGKAFAMIERSIDRSAD